MRGKAIIVILLIGLLGQSCTVYESTTKSLAEAAEQGKIRIVNKDHSLSYYKNIKAAEGQFYGVKGNKEILLAENEIQAIFLVDKAASKEQNIALPVV